MLVILGSSQNHRTIGFGNCVDHFEIRFLVLAIGWVRELKSSTTTHHLETLDVLGEALLNTWLNSEENKGCICTKTREGIEFQIMSK